MDELIFTVEKGAAVLTGALQGYRERMSEEHLGEAIRDAREEIRETRREITEAGREVGSTPEMQRVGESVSHGAARVRDGTRNAARATGSAVTGAATTAREATSAVALRTTETAQVARSRATEAARAARERATHVASTAKVRATEAAHVAKDKAEVARERTAEAVGGAVDRTGEAANAAKESTVHAYHVAEERVRETAADVQRKGAAVQESGRRATKAPGMIARDVKQGVSRMASDWVRAAAYFAVAGVLGLTIFILLTIFLVVGINEVLGQPWGSLLTAVIWGIVAWVVVSRASNLIGDAKTAQEDMKARVRDDVDYVKRPIKREFGGHA